jgi:hypothetical protein
MTDTPPEPANDAPFTILLDAECCGFCAAFNQGVNPKSKIGQCRFNPPTVLITGLIQGPLGPQPAFDSYFPLVLPDWWCRQFERRVRVEGPSMSIDTRTEGPEQ